MGRVLRCGCAGAQGMTAGQRNPSKVIGGGLREGFVAVMINLL